MTPQEQKELADKVDALENRLRQLNSAMAGTTNEHALKMLEAEWDMVCEQIKSLLVGE
jgi:hypothetical protein